MKDRWSQLSMSEKSDLMSLYIRNGISSLEEIKKHYNSFATGGIVNDPPVDPVLKGRQPKANFYQRLLNPFRQTMPDWENRINNKNNVATHKLSWVTDSNGNAIVYPNVQEINGRLYDFTDPRNKAGKWDALDKAIQTGDTIQMTPEQANFWTQHYKEFYPSFNYATGGNLYPDGGTLGKIKSYFAPTYEGTYEQAYAAAKRNNNEYFKWQGNRYKVEDSPEKRQPTESTPDYSSMSFGKAYRQASKDLGVGEEFGWNGNVYLANKGKEESTNLEDLPVYKVWEKVTGKPWSVAKQYGLTDGKEKTNIGLKKALLKYYNTSIIKEPFPDEFADAYTTFSDLTTRTSQQVNKDYSFNVPKNEEGVKILDRSSGKNFGTIIYPTVLDSLAVHGFNTNTNPTITFGLPAQESALSPYRTGIAYIANSYNNPQAAEAMFSTWDIDKNPLVGTLTAIRNNYENSLEEGVRYGAPYAFRKYADYEEPTNVIDWAYDYFKRGKYNQGDPNHTGDVINRGKTLINSREMQDWFYNHWLPQVDNQDEWIQWWNNGKPRSTDNTNQLEMLGNYAAGGLLNHKFQAGGPMKVGYVPAPIDSSLKGNNIEEPFYRPNDSEYIRYWNTLPDNQRLTSNDKYDSYMYWKLNGKPRNFQEARRLGMFTYDHSDNSYHANSIAYDDAGNGRFMKPKNHSTVKYELDYYNKGLVTEEGGYQRQLNNEERKDWENFRKEYELVDDPERPNFYMYRRRHSNGGYLFPDVGSLGKVTPYGQWQYPHQVTTIPSNNITMKGVDYPIIGVSNTGDTKYMLPNIDYLFDGQYVTEYPVERK